VVCVSAQGVGAVHALATLNLLSTFDLRQHHQGERGGADARVYVTTPVGCMDIPGVMVRHVAKVLLCAHIKGIICKVKSTE
jgi:hypothetical protein